MKDFRNEVWLNFTKIGRNFDAMLEIIIDNEEITKNQALTLFFIAMNKNVRVNDIKDKFKANQGNISSLCKKMEQLELIRKVKNKDDERIVNLELLPKGEKIIEIIKKKFRSIEDRLSTKEKDEMIEALSKLNELSMIFMNKMKGK